MGLPRHFFMEMTLKEAEPRDFGAFYDMDLFWECHNFTVSEKNNLVKNAKEKLGNALEFLRQYIKRDASLKQSDFCVAFLEAFHSLFPKALD